MTRGELIGGLIVIVLVCTGYWLMLDHLYGDIEEMQERAAATEKAAEDAYREYVEMVCSRRGGRLIWDYNDRTKPVLCIGARPSSDRFPLSGGGVE